MNNVIIIEDEPAARNELAILLEQEQGFQLVGYAGALVEAKHLIQTAAPDLVFMDINLYDCTAFDVLNELETIPPHIIFVTAYNEFAIKAIKYGALDYLLKPVDEEEFKEAVDRFRSQKGDRAVKAQITLAGDRLQSPHEPRHIALPALGQVRIIALADVRYCQGDGPYTHFFLTNGKKETVSKPLKFYETLLPDQQFLRTHQSYIINTAFVKSVLNHSTILLDEAEEIPISHRRKNEILRKIIP